MANSKSTKVETSPDGESIEFQVEGGQVTELEDALSSYYGSRRPRLNFSPLVVLTKRTTRLVWTTEVTVTEDDFVTVMFASCLPSDVYRVIGPSCGVDGPAPF